MVITTYACPLCQRTYSRKEDAGKGEVCYSKISSSAEISILGLTQRTYNILKIAGIDTVDEVRGKTDSHLLKLKGFGEASLHELHQKLKPFGGQNEGIDRLGNC